MRIALITDGIWPYVLGGMQKHSYYLCKYFAQNQVEVDLFHFNRSDYDISKLEFFTEDEKKFITSYVIPFPESPRFPGHYLINSYRYSKKVYDSIKNKLFLYSFIYTKGFTGWYLISRKHDGKIDCPPIGVKFHGYEMFQKPPGFIANLQQVLFLRRPVKSISKKADVVFSYGGKITDIIRKLGVEEKKIIEIAAGVEGSTLAPNIRPVSGKIKFLFLGRYERRKGIEELNQALAPILAKEKKKFEFHFIGPIPENKKLKGECLIYHGEIRDKQKLGELVSNCDVLVCPSWSEGMPNVILEAMAKGLAVLATDAGATRILVNNNTGWLLPSPDPKLIRTAIENITSLMPIEIDQKKQKALNLVKENFTVEKLMTELYYRVLQNTAT